MHFPPKQIGSRVKFQALDESGVELIGTIIGLDDVACTIKTDEPYCMYAGDPELESIADEFIVINSDVWQFMEETRDGAHISVEWTENRSPIAIDPEFVVLPIMDAAFIAIKPGNDSAESRATADEFISFLKHALNIPDVGNKPAELITPEIRRLAHLLGVLIMTPVTMEETALVILQNVYSTALDHLARVWCQVAPGGDDFLTCREKWRKAYPCSMNPAKDIPGFETLVGEMVIVSKRLMREYAGQDLTPATTPADSFSVVTEYGEIETLPHAEDFIASYGELQFVGFWLYWNSVLGEISETVTQYSSAPQSPDSFPAIVAITEREGKLEKWLDNSADYLPEWANGLLK